MFYKVLSAVLFVLLTLSVWEIRDLRHVRDALIDLNHDKSLYIDSGCRGDYQGSEERLPCNTEQTCE